MNFFVLPSKDNIILRKQIDGNSLQGGPITMLSMAAKFV